MAKQETAGDIIRQASADGSPDPELLWARLGKGGYLAGISTEDAVLFIKTCPIMWGHKLVTLYGRELPKHDVEMALRARITIDFQVGDRSGGETSDWGNHIEWLQDLHHLVQPDQLTLLEAHGDYGQQLLFLYQFARLIDIEGSANRDEDRDAARLQFIEAAWGADQKGLVIGHFMQIAYDLRPEIMLALGAFVNHPYHLMLMGQIRRHARNVLKDFFTVEQHHIEQMLVFVHSYDDLAEGIASLRAFLHPDIPLPVAVTSLVS